MREVEYRAWHKNTKYMFQVSAIQFHWFVCEKHKTYPLDEVELMEYTGLKDRHGNKIFKGDIVIRGGNPKFKYEVMWSDQHARFLLRSLFLRKGGSHGYIALSRNIQRNEIIGNVYQHPHLMEPTP